MAISSRNRAWVAVAVLVLLIAAGAGIYVYELRRSFAPAAGQVPEILAELPAGSPAIAYIDVTALRKLPNSPLAAILGLARAGPQAQDRDYTAFVQDTGFDYTRDLDRAAIAFWPPTPQNSGKSGGEERFLVVADGRFDQQKIEAYARRSGAVGSGPLSVYQVPGDPPVSFKFLSSSRIALASGKNAELPTAPNKSSDAAMQADVNRVAGAPIFAVAQVDRFSNDFYANFKKVPQIEKLARSIQTLTLAGQPAANHIELTLDGTCDSMKDALEVGSLLEISRMGASMVLADPKTKRQITPEESVFLGEVVDNLKVTRQDRLVRMQLDLTPQMLAALSSTPATPAKAKPHKAKP